MITGKEIEDLLAYNHEIQSFEVKGPGDVNDKPLVAKVARAVMAMGNLRDGGYVCVGIDDKQLQAMQPGLNSAQLAGWSDFDKVSARLAKYSDPLSLSNYAPSP